MTPDDMKQAADECERIARELAPKQDAGLFAPVAPDWSGIAEADGVKVPVSLQVVRGAGGTAEGVLLLNGKPYVVAVSLKDDRKPAVAPQLVHRIVNATLSAANTFHHLLAGGGAPLPADSTFDPKEQQWTPPSASPPT